MRIKEKIDEIKRAVPDGTRVTVTRTVDRTETDVGMYTVTRSVRVTIFDGNTVAGCTRPSLDEAAHDATMQFREMQAAADEVRDRLEVMKSFMQDRAQKRKRA